MSIVVSGLLMLAKGFLTGPFVGLAERWMERLDNKDRLAAQQAIEEIHARQARNQAVADIQTGDRGWSPANIVRGAFAVPAIAIFNKVAWTWVLTGEWLKLEEMPVEIGGAIGAVTSFYFLFEWRNQEQRHQTSRAILADERHQGFIAERVEEARKAVRRRFQSRSSGPKGQ